METQDIREIGKGVFAIDTPFEDAPLLSFILESEGLTIIDSGVVDTPKSHLEPALKKLGYKLGDVDRAIITHAHHDHCGGLGQLQDANPHLEVMAHAEDAAWISDSQKFVRDNYYGFAPIWSPSKEFEDRVRRLKGPDISVGRTIKGGDTIDLGNDHVLKVLEVPAHTCGHIALHHEAAGILFTGDSLIGRGHLFKRRLDYFPLYSSVAAYEESLTLYEKLNPTYVATAHHGVCDRNRTAFLIHESRQLIRELRSFLKDALENRSILSLADAVALVEAHWPRYIPGPNTCTTVLAHMNDLADRGAAVKLDWTVMAAWSPVSKSSR